jgi:hypothetical protein
MRGRLLDGLTDVWDTALEPTTYSSRRRILRGTKCRPVSSVLGNVLLDTSRPSPCQWVWCRSDASG